MQLLNQLSTPSNFVIDQVEMTSKKPPLSFSIKIKDDDK